MCQLDEALPERQLPRVVIHGDYGLHNMLFRPDGAAMLLDFELSRLEWRLVDLVIMMSRLSVAKGRAFLTGYQSAYPLSEQEWQLFPQVWQNYMLRGAVSNIVRTILSWVV